MFLFSLDYRSRIQNGKTKGLKIRNSTVLLICNVNCIVWSDNYRPAGGSVLSGELHLSGGTAGGNRKVLRRKKKPRPRKKTIDYTGLYHYKPGISRLSEILLFLH